MKKLFYSLVGLFLFPFTYTCATNLPQDVYEIPLRTLAGKTITLKEYKGKKAIYLKFWATWCQPCRKQMPHLQHTFENYGNDIQVISVNLGINDNLESVKATKEEFALSVPVVVDETGELSRVFNLVGTPYHVLLDKRGNIIHKGHDASKELDIKIQRLARDEIVEPQKLSKKPVQTENIKQTEEPDDVSVKFFVATWCDWYLEKSRPAMSESCVRAQKIVNKLYTDHPQLQWQGIASRLWTGEKELQEYKNKYYIKHPLKIDKSNALFLEYKVKHFPTLIVTRDGKELLSTHNFTDVKKISAEFDKIIQGKKL